MEHMVQQMPDGPVVIVHRGWRTSDATTSTTTGKSEASKRPNHGRLLSESSSETPSSSEGDKATPKSAPTRASKTAQKAFEFVNATSSHKNSDPDVRKRVRAHVMRDFSNSKAQKSKKPAPPQEPDVQTNQEEVDFDIRRALERFATPILIEDSASPDNIPRGPEAANWPFATNIEPKFYTLVGRFFSSMPRVIPLEVCSRKNDVAREWFHLATSDDASFHAMLSSFSVYLSMLGDESEGEEARRHMNHALNLLSNKLGGPKPDITDNTISSVCCLATAAAVSGDLEAWNVHMDGLKYMIDVRGGFPAIDRSLQIKIFRADLAGAFEQMTPAHFNFMREEEGRQPPELIAPNPDTSYIEVEVLLSTAGLHPDLVAILVRLHKIARAIHHTSMMENDLIDPAPYTEYLYSIEYELLAGMKAETDEIIHPFEEASRIGAMIYVKELLGHWPYSMYGSRNLIKRLKHLLRQIIIHETYDILLPCLLFLGAYGSRPGPDRTWFVVNLVKVCQLLNLYEWSDILVVLEKAFWIEKAYKVTHKRIWMEVEVIRDELSVV